MKELQLQRQRAEKGNKNIISRSCIRDQIIEQRNRPGRKVYSVSLQLGEPKGDSFCGHPCNPHGDPPVFGDCWYNCPSDDIVGEDKKHRLHKSGIQASVEVILGYLGMKISLGEEEEEGGQLHSSTAFRSPCRYERMRWYQKLTNELVRELVNDRW